MPEHVRGYIYRLLTPIAGLLVFYGVITETERGLWLQVVGAALLMGEGTLAARNTTIRRPRD